jgi:DNA-binding Xre family transcriptional regulator
MARWSFREDYIVGKFCLEHGCRDIYGPRLEELMNRLHQSGFNSRSEVAVSKRARDFTYLFQGWDSPYAVKQVREICEILCNEGREIHLKELRSFLNEKQQATTAQATDFLSTSPSDLIHMVHIPKGRKFIDVLEDYIEKSNIKPKSRMYSDVGMSDDTFSSIRRGKYKSVAKESIFKICFGLRLRYDDAVILLKSCGKAFEESEILDNVVEYFLKQGPTKDSAYRDKGQEKICYIYDTFAIDADLLESGAKELFWGFRKGDDKDDED